MAVGNYIPQIGRNPNAKLVDRPSLVKSANGSFVTHLCDPLFDTIFRTIFVDYVCFEGMVVTHLCDPNVGI
ncbi:hypothetical protein GCM10011349_07310 [Novosphingobium indicum]|uniref:Uncharacterized protein n=1 Tax=Novosphingobium indicum TaxID=462949 RepID=A0ABQ2JBQ3_9SPHN|nr:hypothetical protein GCM10011349_07310 [Novosphingobium indicum]